MSNNQIKTSSLKSKLTLWTLLLVLSVIVAITGVVLMSYEQYATRNLKTNISELLKISSYSLSAALEFEDEVMIRESLSLLQNTKEIIVVSVRDHNGNMIVSRDFLSEWQRNIPKHQLLSFSSKITNDLGNPIGKVEAIITKHYLHKQVIKNFYTICFISLFFLGISFLFILFIMNKFLKPLITLKESIDEMTNKGFIGKVPLETNDEIGMLAESFNKMSETLQDTTVSRDILAKEVVERNKAEKELRIAKIEAEEANKAKSNFLANMSHDIRTPLNSIIGFSDVLQNTELSQEQMDYCHTIHKSGKILLSSISNILDLSKIEAKKIEIEKVPLNLEKIISNVIELLKPRMNLDEVSISYHYPTHLPKSYMGDSIRIRQILTNLIGNAIKFTHAGEILVQVKQMNLDVANCEIELLISVEDSGIGIPSDRQDHIFELFSQADSSTTRKYGGAGLGLSISKQLIELMDGYIHVDSEVDRGSTFFFSLKLGLIDEEKLITKIKSNGDLNIVLLDKEFEVYEQFKETIEHIRYKTFQFTQSEKNLSTILSSSNYDNIVLFVNGEVIDNLEETIKNTLNLPSENYYIIYLSNTVKPPISENSIYFKKDFYLQDFIHILESKFIQTAPDLNLTHIDQTKVNLLVVEDNTTNQKLIGLLLKKFGFQYEIVSSGQEAIEKIKNTEYSACLLDLHMPMMSGIELTKYIRKELRSNLPIIAISAAVLKEDKDQAFKAGMQDFLAKPIEPEKLKETILKWVKTKQSNQE